MNKKEKFRPNSYGEKRAERGPAVVLDTSPLLCAEELA